MPKFLKVVETTMLNLNFYSGWQPKPKNLLWTIRNSQFIMCTCLVERFLWFGFYFPDI